MTGGLQPELDEHAVSHLRGLRSYGYEDIRSPEISAVTAFQKSLNIVIDGLMDRDLGPHLADAFRSAADVESEERLADLVGDLEELRQASQFPACHTEGETAFAYMDASRRSISCRLL